MSARLSGRRAVRNWLLLTMLVAGLASSCISEAATAEPGGSQPIAFAAAGEKVPGLPKWLKPDCRLVNITKPVNRLNRQGVLVEVRPAYVTWQCDFKVSIGRGPFTCDTPVLVTVIIRAHFTGDGVPKYEINWSGPVIGTGRNVVTGILNFSRRLKYILEHFIPIGSSTDGAAFGANVPCICGSVPSSCRSLTVLINGMSTEDPLTTAPLATGYGQVAIQPLGQVVNCPYRSDYRTCYGMLHLPPGTRVKLTATADPTNASYFAGWSGDGQFDCPASSATCIVTVGQLTHIAARFSARVFKLTIANNNPNEGAVVQSAFSGTGPTYETLHCGAGVSRCTAYYPLVDAHTMPIFNGPAPLSLMGNGLLYQNQQWYSHFVSGCDDVRVVLDGSNAYTVCYYSMTADRTVTVDWTTTPPQS